MKRFSIFVLFLFLIMSTIIGQDWSLFLNKYIGNLYDADSTPGMSEQYSISAVEQRKSEELFRAYDNEKSQYNSATGNNDPSKYPTHTIYAKDRMSSMNAALSIGTPTHKQNARHLMYNSMLYHGIDGQGKGVDFTSFYIAGYIQNLKPETFSTDKLIELRDFYAENSGGIWGRSLWAYNTENHCQMYRSTTYGLGLKWPDHSFIVRANGSRENGTYMYNQIETNHIFNYFPYLLKYGMGENLSPVYMGAHIRPWNVFYELARHYNRHPAMEVSGAVLEYNYALLGLNSLHNMHIGMVNRAQIGLGYNWNFNSIAKVFGGYKLGETLTERGGSLVAESQFMPHEITRKIIAGDIQLPYTLVQTVARNNWYQREVRIEDSGANPPGHSYSSEYSKTVFRYNFVDRHYALGSGNLKILSGDSPDYADGLAGSATWGTGALFFSSPQRHITENWGDKFFEDRKAGMTGNVGSDSWVGYSPFMEMAQFENTVMVYCVIPADQAHHLAQIHLSSPKAGESIIADDVRKAYYAKYKASVGEVYVAFIPIHYNTGNRMSSGFVNMERIIDSGATDDGHCGFIVEMAHSSECSFVEFKSKVNATGMTWDKQSSKLTFTSRKGNLISLNHSNGTVRNDRLPTIEITPVDGEKTAIDWVNYPVLMSPYMRVIHEDGREKLILNDNERGIKIDFDGSQVHYTDFNEMVPVNTIQDSVPERPQFHGSFQFIEDASGEPIKNVPVKFNGQEYLTDNSGIILFPELDYTEFNIVMNAPGYPEFLKSGIEIFSDTVIVFRISETFTSVVLKILDLANNNPVNRPIVTINGTVTPASTHGILKVTALESPDLKLKIEHNNYFTLEGLYKITSDTLVLKMTNKQANVVFHVSDQDGALSNVAVKFDVWELFTNYVGIVYYYMQQARVNYSYSLMKNGYVPIEGSFFLESDTSLVFQMELQTGLNWIRDENIKVFPNPSNGFLTFDMRSGESNIDEIKLINVLGDIVLVRKPDSFPYIMDISGLKPGVFIAKVSTTNGNATLRILVL